MFEVLIGEKKIKVDILEIANDIDDVLHKKLTKKTGVTVDHHEIAKFVISIINESNKKEREMTRIIKELEEELKKK